MMSCDSILSKFTQFIMQICGIQLKKQFMNFLFESIFDSIQNPFEQATHDLSKLVILNQNREFEVRIVTAQPQDQFFKC